VLSLRAGSIKLSRLLVVNLLTGLSVKKSGLMSEKGLTCKLLKDWTSLIVNSCTPHELSIIHIQSKVGQVPSLYPVRYQVETGWNHKRGEDHE
jgi:hypothetical protein